MEQSDLVYIKRVPGKGRGVFARKHISRGESIERVPVMLVPVDEIAGGLMNPALSRFFFMWNKHKVALALGYGSLYNHSYRPNAQYRHAFMSMDYYALRDIAPGEEITINYNGDPKDRGPMSFRVIEAQQSRNGSHRGGSTQRKTRVSTRLK